MLLPDELAQIVNRHQLGFLGDLINANGNFLSIRHEDLPDVTEQQLGDAAKNWRAVRGIEWEFDCLVTTFDLFVPMTVYHFRLPSGALASFPFRYLDDKWMPMDLFAAFVPDEGGKATVMWNGHPEMQENPEVEAMLSDEKNCVAFSKLGVGALALYAQENE